MNTNPIDKLRILLPHWAEHNREHAVEMRRWQAIIEKESDVKLGRILDQVAAHMEQAGELLQKAAEGLAKPAASATLNHHHH